MSSLKNKKYNLLIDKKINRVKRMKKAAKEVTLTEFVENFENWYDEVTLGAFWYSVNDDVDYANVSYGGTDPD